MSAYADALRLLARRELSAFQLRSRLRDRKHGDEEVENAISRLLKTGVLDDRRVAGAYARTASSLKGRGRLRVVRELEAMGIAREISADAVAEVFGDLDPDALIDKAVQKKLRGRSIETVQERARLYRFLIRQGFTSAEVSAALRRVRESTKR